MANGRDHVLPDAEALNSVGAGKNCFGSLRAVFCDRNVPFAQPQLPQRKGFLSGKMRILLNIGRDSVHPAILLVPFTSRKGRPGTML
jgi:hypothetical protein